MKESKLQTHDDVQKMLHTVFEQANQEVYNSISDVKFSGSTCTSIFVHGRNVYSCNLGDSRTLLIRSAFDF